MAASQSGERPRTVQQKPPAALGGDTLLKVKVHAESCLLEPQSSVPVREWPPSRLEPAWRGDQSSDGLLPSGGAYQKRSTSIKLQPGETGVQTTGFVKVKTERSGPGLSYAGAAPSRGQVRESASQDLSHGHRH